jgi:hypothetical protein
MKPVNVGDRWKVRVHVGGKYIYVSSFKSLRNAERVEEEVERIKQEEIAECNKRILDRIEEIKREINRK